MKKRNFNDFCHTDTAPQTFDWNDLSNDKGTCHFGGSDALVHEVIYF